jgi:hypothetical protein
MRLAILLLATTIVAAPVVHTHPFSGSGSGTEGSGIAGPNVCAMCAVAAQQITVVRINIAAPVVVTDLLIAAAPHHRSLKAFRPLASRAPPTA